MAIENLHPVLIHMVAPVPPGGAVCVFACVAWPVHNLAYTCWQAAVWDTQDCMCAHLYAVPHAVQLGAGLGWHRCHEKNKKGNDIDVTKTNKKGNDIDVTKKNKKGNDIDVTKNKRKVTSMSQNQKNRA